MSGQRHVPKCRRRPHGRQDRHPEAQRADEQRGPTAQRGPQALTVGEQAHAGRPGRPGNWTSQRQRHGRLRDRGARARARDPHPDAVEQDRVDDDVEDRPTGGHDEGRARIQQAAQHAGGRQNHEHARQPRAGGA